MNLRSMRWGIVVLVVHTVPARSQATISEFPVGARNVSLVNANLAEASDISVMYENPAPLAFLENRTALFNHSMGNGLSGMQENVALPLILDSPFAVALGLDVYHQGYVGNPEIPGLHLFEFGYDLAVASALTSTLSIGGTASLRRATMAGAQGALGTSFSFGVDYAPTPDISYGLVYGGMGNDVSYVFDGAGRSVESNPLQKTLEVGATMTYPSSISLRPPVLVVSFANEKVFGTKGVIYKAGVEIRPVSSLELRFGYQAGPDAYAVGYGIGFLANPVSLQYAIYPVHGSGVLRQQFTAVIDV